MSNSSPAGSDRTEDGKSKGGSSLEGLRVNFLTLVASLGVIATLAVSIGVYTSKQGAVEARIDLAERNLGDGKNSNSELKMNMALLEARIRQIESARSDDAKKLDRIESGMQAIGDMVLLMCQTTSRPGVTCKLSRP